MFRSYIQTLRKVRFYHLFVTVMAQGSSVSTSEAVCQRLGVVIGQEEKENQVIVCSNPSRPPSQHIIYFGGDVQDYKENMSINNPAYAEWDLDSTARLLQSKFKDSAVFVIKPAEMLLNTFSIYKNFLNFDEDGRPEFSKDFGAIIHLVKLYQNAMNKVASEGDDTCKLSSEASCAGSVPVRLFGFSKGCVVINQLMFELETFKSSPLVKSFLDRLVAIYWLDGGHIGRKDAYITDEEILKSITSLNKELTVHVSAYQIKDINRPWIGKEEKKFVSKLKELGANIKEYQHFMNEPGSINNHWKVLTKV